MLAESGLMDEIEANIRRNATEVYTLYGDPGHPLRRHLVRPYANPKNDPEREFSTRISPVRQCVELGFVNIL